MLNVDQTIDLLERIVEGREDYIYEVPPHPTVVEDDAGSYEMENHECVYSTPSGEPSCIVGYALYETDREKFNEVHKWEWEELDEGDIAPRVERAAYLSQVHDLFDTAAAGLLNTAQTLQDRRLPWGEVLEEVRMGYGEGES